MDALKKWLGLSLVALLAILAGGWFLLVAPQRSEAADLRAQTEAEQLTNEQLETQLEVLRARAKELPAKRAELAEVAAKVPDGPSLPDLVRALTAAAREAGVVLTSVTPGTPVPLAAAPAAPAADPAADPAAAPAADPAAAPAAAPAAPASGLSELPVVLEVDGDFYQLAQFLALLEDLPRAVRITSLVVQAGGDGGTAQRQTLSSSVTASAYLTSGGSTAAPAAPAAPAAAPAAPTVEGATAPAAPAPPATTSEPAAQSTGTAR